MNGVTPPNFICNIQFAFIWGHRARLKIEQCEQWAAVSMVLAALHILFMIVMRSSIVRCLYLGVFLSTLLLFSLDFEKIIRSLREMPPGWQLARQRWDCGCVYHMYLGTGVLLLDYSGQDLFVSSLLLSDWNIIITFNRYYLQLLCCLYHPSRNWYPLIFVFGPLYSVFHSRRYAYHAS